MSIQASGARAGARKQVLLRLVRVLADLRSNPISRRAMRMDPPAALDRLGLSGDLADGELPVRPAAAELVLTLAHLFGAAADPTADPLPTELRLISYGVKPAALIQGREGELLPLLSTAETRGWTAILSPHEWSAAADVGKADYANLASNLRPARPGSGAYRSLVVSPDQDRALQIWLALAFDWQDYLGRLLGYPACCTRSFGARWSTAAESHQGDLAPLVLDASGPGPHDWRANVFARYFGAALVQHFPCHFGCRETVAIGARAAAAMTLFEPTALRAARELLASPALYGERDGVVVLPGARPERRGEAVHLPVATYEPRFATAPLAPLARAVAGAGEVIWDGAHLRTAGGVPVDARLAWFAEGLAGQEAGGGGAIPELATAGAG